MCDSYHKNQPGLDELITLSEASQMSGLSPSQIRLLVSKRVIWGKKLGKNWFTTAHAISEYIKLPRKTGPKKKV